eukprot:Amastigsp_a508736_16.p4 type:complete len:148 gc:universal Amastigsp_a508736_16:651-1094(+)
MCFRAYDALKRPVMTPTRRFVSALNDESPGGAETDVNAAEIAAVSSAVMVTPQRISPTAIALPARVRGTLSPKPTVPMVTTANQSESEMPSVYERRNSIELARRSSSQTQWPTVTSPTANAAKSSTTSGVDSAAANGMWKFGRRVRI